jgi:alcohol dehydrogenase
VERKLAAYWAPRDFIPGGNAIGMIEAVRADAWQLKKGQSVVSSSHLVARENVPEPGQILIGVTSPNGIGDTLQQLWTKGTLSEYPLFPAQTVTSIERLDNCDAVHLTANCRSWRCFGRLDLSPITPKVFSLQTLRGRWNMPARPTVSNLSS